MKLGLYPGCSLEGTAREYNESVHAVLAEFNIEVQELGDWNCCGATAAHNLNRNLSLALPARVLAMAEKDGFDEIVVPCAACYNRLSATRHELLHDNHLKNDILETIGMSLEGHSRIVNIVEMLDAHVMPHLEGKIKNPFRHKAACYYGCLLVRPNKILKFDRMEDPQSMDILMKKIGAETVDWAFKVECCGAGFSVARTDIVARLCGNILEDATSRGAELIVVACPMCHSNLDMRRKKIEKHMEKKYPIPILYITQAIGMAIGIDSKKLGLHRHLVPVELTSRVDPPVASEGNVQAG